MKPDSDRITLVAPSRYVTIPLASVVTGYTPKAIEQKIGRGVWLEGAEYVRAPDGRLLVDLDGFARWAQGKRC